MGTKNHNPQHTESELGQTFCQYYCRLARPTQSTLMGHVSIKILEGIESFAADNPKSAVARLQADMLQAIGSDTVAGDPHTVSCFNELYEQAYEIVFPATRAYLKICHDVNEIASAHSLSAIELDTIHCLDIAAHTDKTLQEFRTELIYRMEMVHSVEDVIAYSQVFETYGEIIAFNYLRSKVLTERLPVREGLSTPDFKCTLQDHKSFFVEVKTFDIVDANFRNREMMEDGLQTKIELEEQIKANKAIAFAETVIDPFRRYGETDTYDPYSLIRVIDTLRNKSLQAFKEEQFKDGPTFALALTDRLRLPRGKFEIAPYYFCNYTDGSIVSGVLWHMAYGRPGTPIFRLPDFPGAKSLEGFLNECQFGLFTDQQIPFYGPGMIVLDRENSGHAAYGLVNKTYFVQGHWSIDDTEKVLNTLCDHWNDHDNSLSHGTLTTICE